MRWEWQKEQTLCRCCDPCHGCRALRPRCVYERVIISSGSDDSPSQHTIHCPRVDCGTSTCRSRTSLTVIAATRKPFVAAKRDNAFEVVLPTLSTPASTATNLYAFLPTPTPLRAYYYYFWRPCRHPNAVSFGRRVEERQCPTQKTDTYSRRTFSCFHEKRLSASHTTQTRKKA